MIQYQKTNLCTKFVQLIRSLKNDVIFRKYGSDVTMMTASTQNQFFYKIFVKTNPHAKLSVPMTLV